MAQRTERVVVEVGDRAASAGDRVELAVARVGVGPPGVAAQPAFVTWSTLLLLATKVQLEFLYRPEFQRKASAG